MQVSRRMNVTGVAALVCAAVFTSVPVSGQVVSSHALSVESATPLTSLERATPFRVVANTDREIGVELELDAAMYDGLRDVDGVVLQDFALDQGVRVELVLEQFHVVSPNAELIEMGDDGADAMQAPDVLLFRGVVSGDQSSTVFLGLSPHGSNGFIETGGKTYVLSAGRYGTDDPTLVYSMSDLPDGAINFVEQICSSGPEHMVGRPDLSDAPVSTRAAGCRVIELALDTDYETAVALFGGDTTATLAYYIELIGAVSTIYQRDVNASFEVVYARMWATNSDPYFGDIVSFLETMQSEWTTDPALISVPRDLAHVLTSRNGGGGVAWTWAVCDATWGYGASGSLNGSFPQPLAMNSLQNWDVIVTAHELGHNCGTLHTHDSDQYAPIIDGCGLGDCAGSSNGTLMSYCHTCSGGLANMALAFHTRVITEIDSYLSTSPCLDTAGTPVFSQQPQSQSACNGDPVVLDASATDNGTVSYQWYKDGSALVGQTGSSYSIASFGVSDAGDYHAVAMTACDSAQSSMATLGLCAPGCAADLTTQGAGVGDAGYGVSDGVTSASDINYYVNLWVNGDLGADVTTQGASVGGAGYGVPDGTVTAADINFFVNLWVSGCP